jgi:hypothetical protein
MRSAWVVALVLGCEEDPLDMEPPVDAGDTGALRLDAGSFGDAEPDASLEEDAGAPDAMLADAAELDAAAGDAASMCDPTDPGPPDRERVVLVGQPFTAMPAVDGTEIRSLSLSAAGALMDVGARLDVGFRPSRIEMSLDGSYALVLGEDGELASVRVVDAQTFMVVDSVALPSAGYGDLRFASDGSTLFAVGSNSTATGGISTILLGCDGSLAVQAQEFYAVRLANSLVFLPDGRAILLGGQASFAPVDPDDVRLLSYAPGAGWTLIDAFDIYADFVDALRIAINPEGSTLVIPNGSPFSADGNQASIVGVAGSVLTESVRLMNLEDAREALFSTDGQTVLISLLTPGEVAVLADRGAGFAEVDRLSGIGLAENMAIVKRGQAIDTVLVTSVDAAGEPNVAVLRITAAGSVMVTGMVNLGSGSEHIPVGVAIQP